MNYANPRIPRDDEGNVNEPDSANLSTAFQNGHVNNAQSHTSVTRSLSIPLFISHFLSTWNSRLFEAAVVYFLAALFPNDLLPVSVYALLRNIVAIVLTAPIGAWIDKGNRLTVVRLSILGQRVSVAASCAFFWAMLWHPDLHHRARYSLFAGTVALACVEKLSAGVNMVSVERDWVVVITNNDDSARISMNARLRRIDLFCKLVGPLVIALVAAASVKVAVYSTMAMNVASVYIEYECIGRVFRKVPDLQRHREHASLLLNHQQALGRDLEDSNDSFWTRSRRAIRFLFMLPSLRVYFGHRAVVPSFALSLLYLTVLSFSGQMLTYLLASHITLWQVGIIRAVSSVFELSATWSAPRLMRRIGVIRTGLWSVGWQMTWLAGGISWFFYASAQGHSTTGIRPAAGLAAAVALSRVGLWGYDLSAQNIIQDEVEGDSRGTFSIVELGFQNVFDLLSWVLTIIWSDPAHFRWPVLISVAAVYAAGGLYAYFLRQRRGHLIHPPPCIPTKSGRSRNSS